MEINLRKDRRKGKVTKQMMMGFFAMWLGGSCGIFPL